MKRDHKIKIIRTILVTFLICYYAPLIKADDKLNLITPTLTYLQAQQHVENILRQGGSFQQFILTDIRYNYTTGEWLFRYEIEGSHFTIFLNDKNPTIYKSVGGA